MIQHAFSKLSLVNLIQSNLDYSKCQGPQESFRKIGSSNDRKREFLDIFEKALTFHRTSLFCQSRVFRDRNICQSIKENELLGGCGLIVSYALQV